MLRFSHYPARHHRGRWQVLVTVQASRDVRPRGQVTHPAVYLHAAEASHGDLGIYAPGDTTLMISKSGSTSELLAMLPFLRDLPSPSIGILGNVASPLASQMDVVLDASVEREADPENLAP